MAIFKPYLSNKISSSVKVWALRKTCLHTMNKKRKKIRKVN